MSIETAEIKTSRGHFVAELHGAPGAPTIVALHGFPDTPRSLRPLAGHLGGAGYRVVAPFLRGYAPSTLDGPFDVDTLADDIAAIAGAVAPSEKIALIGHDWGAAITFVAAERHPHLLTCAVAMSVPHPLALVRALIRSPAQRRRSAYMAFFQLRGLSDAVVARDDFRFIDDLWRRWSPGHVLGPGDRRALHDCLAASMPAPLGYYRAMAWPPRQALARIRAGSSIAIPTLTLRGVDDGCIGPEAFEGQSRFFHGRFRHEEIAGAGHFVQLERPAEVAATVLDWLGRNGLPAHRAAVR